MAAAMAEAGMGPLSVPDQGGEQADLWADMQGVGAGPLDDIGTLGADLFMKPRRGGGRPKGARNQSTEAWRTFFLSQHRSPLLVLADVYSMPVEELAMRLRCKAEDALKLQLRAAEIVAPYIHAKQPLAIKADALNLPTLHLHMPVGMAAPTAAANEGGVVDLFANEIQQIQGLTALSAQCVGMSALAGGGKGQQDQGLVVMGEQTSTLAGGAAGAGNAASMPRDGGVARDAGGLPPTDFPPVSPLTDQRDDTV
jgi:hypothetical protein